MKLRALPTLFKVGLMEAIAYRAEMIVWVLGTTMPFIMMVMWTAVAQYQPIVLSGGKTFTERSFILYFLSVFIVRQLVSAWAAWEINFEVRQGTLAMRLLRPIHPLVSFAASNLAGLPLRFVVVTPVAISLFVLALGNSYQRDFRVWILWPISVALAWCITFLINVILGSLSLFIESSIKMMEAYLALFFVFSGYLFPLELFPPWLGQIAKYLPFRFQIGVPVSLMTGAFDFSQAVTSVAQQLTWAAALLATATTLWRFGIKRFQAFGG